MCDAGAGDVSIHLSKSVFLNMGEAWRKYRLIFPSFADLSIEVTEQQQYAAAPARSHQGD